MPWSKVAAAIFSFGEERDDLMAVWEGVRAVAGTGAGSGEVPAAGLQRRREAGTAHRSGQPAH